MSNSELIAGLGGPLLAVIAIAILVNPRVREVIASETINSPGMIFFAGILTLLAGLAIVRTHNIWEPDWRVLVTLLGWLAVIGGMARILVPERVVAMRARIAASDKAMAAWSAFALLLGLFLSAKGYGLL